MKHRNLIWFSIPLALFLIAAGISAQQKVPFQNGIPVAP